MILMGTSPLPQDRQDVNNFRPVGEILDSSSRAHSLCERLFHGGSRLLSRSFEYALARPVVHESTIESRVKERRPNSITLKMFLVCCQGMLGPAMSLIC